jgi:glutaredoxin-related protein
MTNVHDRISTLVTTNDIVLFMKGTPMFPQCGFSSTAVAILERLGVEFEGDRMFGQRGLSGEGGRLPRAAGEGEGG